MKNRDGFSMIELAFAVVVIGILASLAIPRMERDRQIEGIDNILSSIRYTQHMALVDDKTDPSDSHWQKKLWSIRFANTNNQNAYYVIGSDANKNGSISKDESAIDPANGKHFYTANPTSVAEDESSNILLGKKFGINKITFSGGCANVNHIAFDRLGRPHVGLGSATYKYSTYMKDDCNITFEYVDSTPGFTITIEPETGYAYVSADDTNNSNYSQL